MDMGVARRLSGGGVMSMLLLLLALLLQVCAPCEAQLDYPVGGDPSGLWAPAEATFYQDWADQLTLYINDSISFVYDSALYDVTSVWDAEALNSCSLNRTAWYSKTGDTLFLFSNSGTFYFTSSGSSDCQDGMRFSVQVYDQYAAWAPGPGTSAGRTGPGTPDLYSAPAPPPIPSSKGVEIRFAIPWEPQADPSFYTTFLPKELQANGLRFLPNSSVLVFSYEKFQHRILEVAESEFDNCTVPSSPIAIFANPDAGVPLLQNGVYYYIDGIGNSCASGNMKLRVQVGPDLGPISLETSTTTKRFPWEAVVIPCACGIALVTFIWCCKVWYSRRCGLKPRAKYEERHVVTSGVYEPTFGKSGRQQSAIISGLLAGRGGRIVFTFKELQRATDKFSADNEVGRGGFGTVYRGTLDDGSVVAIKRTKHAGANDMDQFVNEVSILSQVNNRHLVKLLGCCVELDVPLLVYEFIPNGTLQDHLSLAQFSTKLDWPTRFKIAIQTAEALKYLHVQATPPIFHRDVKSANILLDDAFNAKVADFGLSKLVDLEATHVSTVVKGTPGYLDPEYFHNYQLTDKADVYSYGIVLLELITSRKPIDMTQSEGHQNLAVSAVPLIKAGRCREVIDAQMSSTLSDTDFQTVEAVAQVAVACLVTSRAARPSMSEVVEMLQRIKGSTLKAEEFYTREDTRQRAAAQSIIKLQALAYMSPDSIISDSRWTTSQTPSSTDSSDSNTPMHPR